MSNKLCLNTRTQRTYDFASLYSFKVTMSTVSLVASIISLIRNKHCITDYRNYWCGKTGLVIFKVIEFVVPVTIEWSVIGENGIYTNNGKPIIQLYNCLPDETARQPQVKIENLAKNFLQLVSDFLLNTQDELLMEETFQIRDLGPNYDLGHNKLFISNSYKMKYKLLIDELFSNKVIKGISFEYKSNDAECPMNQPAYIYIDHQINTVNFHVCRSYCLPSDVENYKKTLLSWYLTALGESYKLNSNNNYVIYHTNPVFINVDKVGMTEYCASSTDEIIEKDNIPPLGVLYDYNYNFQMFDPSNGIHALCFLALPGITVNFNPECTDVL